MDDYLLFRLYGPLASWGDTAIGGTRPSAPWPGRSAIIGLLAAALGVRREDEARQRSLVTAYGVGICIESTGELLRDYHTTQVPPERRGVRHRTRRDELNAENLNTILSQRDYRADALYTVAVWRKADNDTPTLQQLADALTRPAFPLYLGRKSCPPALPLGPRIVENAESLREAFASVSFRDDALLAGLPLSHERIFVWEQMPNSGMQALHVTSRRDEPTSRHRWQFTERDEFYHCEARSNATGRTT